MCLVKIPRDRSKPVTGFAGRAGRPVGEQPGDPSSELAGLRARLERLQAALETIRREIDRGEAGR
jgi:hypothetical protein